MGILYSQAIKGQEANIEEKKIIKKIIDIARNILVPVVTYYGIEVQMNDREVKKVNVTLYRNPYSELDEYWMDCPPVFQEVYPGDTKDDFRAVQTWLYREVVLRFIKEHTEKGRGLLFSTSEVNTTLAVPAVIDDKYKNDPMFKDVLVHHYNHTIVPAGMPEYNTWMFERLKIANEFKWVIHDYKVDLVKLTGAVSDFITGCSTYHTHILRSDIFKEFAHKIVEDDLFGNSEGSDIERWQGKDIQKLVSEYKKKLGGIITPSSLPSSTRRKI